MKLTTWREIPEQSWREIGLTLPDVSSPKKGLWSAGQFLKEVQTSPLLWVRRQADEVQAVISLRRNDENIYEVIYLYTAPRWRRQRIMESLLAEVLSSLPAGAQVWLEVAATNTAAQALYKKLGFVLQGVRPGYYSDQTDSWLYRHYKEV